MEIVKEIKCKMCGGKKVASYIDFITKEEGVDTCPDCNGSGIEKKIYIN